NRGVCTEVVDGQDHAATQCITLSIRWPTWPGRRWPRPRPCLRRLTALPRRRSVRWIEGCRTTTIQADQGLEQTGRRPAEPLTLAGYRLETLFTRTSPQPAERCGATPIPGGCPARSQPRGAPAGRPDAARDKSVDSPAPPCVHCPPDTSTWWQGGGSMDYREAVLDILLEDLTQALENLGLPCGRRMADFRRRRVLGLGRELADVYAATAPDAYHD